MMFLGIAIASVAVPFLIRLASSRSALSRMPPEPFSIPQLGRYQFEQLPRVCSLERQACDPQHLLGLELLARLSRNTRVHPGQSKPR